MAKRDSVNDEQKAKSYSNTRKGVPGVAVQSGKFAEEYLGALTEARNFYTVYDKMRRSDYQIIRMLNALKAPIRSGKFLFRVLDETDSEQEKQANFKNNLMYRWGNQSFKNIIDECLSYLDFGFAVFEPYGKVVDDPEFGSVVTLNNIGLIKQKTIEKWEIKDNLVKKIYQKVTGTDNNVDKWIDGKELFFLNNMKEGDNFEGLSVLRPVYGNWVRKNLYLKMDMIGIEKMSIGTPIFYVPRAMLNDAKEMDSIKNLGNTFTSHEQAFLILDERMKDGGFDIIEGKYNASAVNDSIKREDLGMLDSILASFLAIGTLRAGGNSQNEGQMDMYLTSLVSIAEYIAEVLSEIAHMYYVLNFGIPKTRVDMSVSGITRKDATQTMEILRGYVTSKVIRPDDKLEGWIREELKLPPVEEATVRDIDATPDYKSDGEGQEDKREEQRKPEDPNVEEED